MKMFYYFLISFKEFVDIIHPYDKFYDFIRILDIKTKEEYLRIFNDLQEINDKALIIYFIKKYNDSNLDFLEVNEIRDYLYASLNNKLKQKLNDSNSINTLLEDILSGKKSYLNLNYLNDRKSLYYATYIADIDSVDTLENIGSIPLNVLEKMNKKHLREIMSLLDNYFLKGEKIILACNIYLSIGYERAKDLLNPNANKNYGPVNSDVLKKMFLSLKKKVMAMFRF